jgi:hypothetical protein
MIVATVLRQEKNVHLARPTTPSRIFLFNTSLLLILHVLNMLSSSVHTALSILLIRHTR